MPRYYLPNSEILIKKSAIKTTCRYIVCVDQTDVDQCIEYTKMYLENLDCLCVEVLPKYDEVNYYVIFGGTLKRQSDFFITLESYHGDPPHETNRVLFSEKLSDALSDLPGGGE